MLRISKYCSVLIFSLLLIGSSGSLKAQEPIAGNYKDNFIQGNYLILEQNYPMALKYFREAYFTDSSTANINYKMGLCYLHSLAEKRKALPYLRRAALDVTRNYDEFEPRLKKAPQSALYLLGQAYHLNDQYDSALTYLESYNAVIGERNPELKREVEQHISWAKYAKEYTSSPIPVKITNLGDSINSSVPEYGPVVSLDENTIYFTSRRLTSIDDKGQLTLNEVGIDGLPYEDIYVSYRKRDSTWTKAQCLSPVIGTSVNNEATISLTTDAQTLFIFKGDNGGDIFQSNLEGDHWTTPTMMGGDISSSSWETHGTLSADGNTFYFVSDRPGGFGGRDIYRCVRINGRWSKALNLGPTINTPFDEDAPFIHPDKVTLFFSSNGHSSMGGFDIFFTALDDSGKWAKPVNMGYPINTADDDIYYTTSADGHRAYFSSVREDSRGDKDLYMAVLKGDSTRKPLTLLKGFIYNADGSPLTQDIRIMVYNDDTNEMMGEYRPNRQTGTFAIILAPGFKYRIEYNVDNVMKGSEVIDIPYGSDFASIERALNLDNFVLGTPKDPIKVPNKNLEFINIQGIVMDKKNPDQVLTKNVTVSVKNDQGMQLATATTINGVFRFSHLDAKHNYLIVVDELDKNAARFNTITVTDEASGDALEAKKVPAKDDKFNITATGKVVTLRLTPTPDIPVDQGANITLSLDSNSVSYQLFFKYGVVAVDPNSVDFTRFLDNAMAVIAKKGNITFRLISSASQVPTRTYPTNKALSEDRAIKAKQAIINGLKARGVEESKIKWLRVRSYVLGPTYHADFVKNQKTYEKFQFIKITGE